MKSSNRQKINKRVVKRFFILSILFFIILAGPAESIARQKAQGNLEKYCKPVTFDCLISIVKADQQINNKSINQLDRMSAAQEVGKMKITDPVKVREIESTVEILIEKWADKNVPFSEKMPLSYAGSMGSPAVKPLIRALKHENRMVRIWSVEALANTKDPRALKPLEVLLHDRDKLIRVRVARGLKHMGHLGVDLMIEALGDKKPEVRIEAIESLKILKDPRAIKPLVLLFDKENSEVRYKAGLALVYIGEPAIEDVIGMLNHEERKVRAEAINILIKIGDEKVVDALMPLMNDPDVRIRREAARAVKIFENRKTLAPEADSKSSL